MPDDFDAVCFDLDDTLFDYTQYIRHGLDAAADLLEARTGERYHDELRSLYFEEGRTDATFDHLVARTDLPPDVVPGLVEAYHSSPDSLDPYEEAGGVLDRLDRSHALGVVTAGRNGHAKLAALGLDAYFDVVVATPDHPFSKAEPVAFERALDALGVRPARACYVGDDPRNDFAAPNALGMTTVRLRRGRHRERSATAPAAPDVGVDSLEEILKLV